MTRRWAIWLSVLGGLLVLALGIGPLVRAQGAAGIGQGVGWTGLLGALAWLHVGLWWARRRPAWRRVGWALLGSDVVYLWSLWFWMHERRGVALAILGTWLMGLAFVAGLRGLRGLLALSHPVTGVARTVLDEALRMKIAWLFMVGIALLVPMLPLLTDPKELLNYRVQTFLNWSLSVLTTLLTLLAVLLSTLSVCNEIKFKQIYLTLSKPVGRGQYVLGKWLGVVLLNLWLLAVAGVGIAFFARLLQMEPAVDDIDRDTVDNQVLVARATQSPGMPANLNFPKLYDERLVQLRKDNPDVYGTPQEPRRLTPAQEEAVRTVVITRWHTVPPGGEQTYVFDHLQSAQTAGTPLQLRLKPHAARPPNSTGKVPLGLVVNGRDWDVGPTGQPRALLLNHDQYTVLSIAPQVIDPDGRITLTIRNYFDPAATNPDDAVSVSFPLDGGMEMLYRVRGFEANLAAGLSLIWWQTAFLAAVGVMAGTFLSFPVACLVCMMVLVVGACNEFLNESLKYYGVNPPENVGLWELIIWPFQALWWDVTHGQINEALKVVIYLVGEMVLWLFPSLARFSPSALVSDGREVSALLLRGAALWLGLLGAGLSGLLGWSILSRREVARATS